jgi:hypothetical protein
VEAVVTYMAELCQQHEAPEEGSGVRAWRRPESALKHVASAIGALYKGLDVPCPTHSVWFAEAMDGLVAQYTKEGPRPPVTWSPAGLGAWAEEEWRRLRAEAASERGEDERLRRARRDRAIVLVALATAARPSDLASRDVQHLRRVPGGAELSFAGSKDDRRCRKPPVGIAALPDTPGRCPVRALGEHLGEQWGAQRRPRQPLFCKADPRGTERLGAERVAGVMKEALGAAGLPGTAKSYRSSVATAVARAGATWTEVRGLTRHRSLDVLLDHYVQHAPSQERTMLALGLWVRRGAPAEHERHAREALRAAGLLAEDAATGAAGAGDSDDEECDDEQQGGQALDMEHHLVLLRPE